MFLVQNFLSKRFASHVRFITQVKALLPFSFQPNAQLQLKEHTCFLLGIMVLFTKIVFDHNGTEHVKS